MRDALLNEALEQDRLMKRTRMGGFKNEAGLIEMAKKVQWEEAAEEGNISISTRQINNKLHEVSGCL